jgi:hypothetical protein
MKTIIKIIAIIIIIILISSSVYVGFFLDGDDDENGDTTPPTIDDITRDTIGTTGKITTISVTFSDNVEVTEAKIIYKSMNEDMWTIGSILTGEFDIKIPSESDDDFYYYVTVDDAAGNGPVGDPSIDGTIYYTITVSEEVGDLSHLVFIEEATGETCKNCPGVSELIHEYYYSEDYNFEYVSLIVQHDKALNRLQDHYKNKAQPTLYIDGGYKVVLGGAKKKDDLDKSKYLDPIRSAEQRTVPPIQVKTDVFYKNGSDNFTTNVLIKNYGEETYKGLLKVYLVEIISRYSYSEEGVNPIINNGFLDFIIEETIEVPAGGEYSPAPKDWSLTDEDGIDLDPKNLKVISVVFSSISEKKYSWPLGETEEEKNPFDAYFADAANGTRLIEGNLPPTVVIARPVKGKFHLFGYPLFNSLFKVTRLIGWTKIVVNADDSDGSIEKVEFYIDNELLDTVNSAPYEYILKRIGLFKTILFRKYMLKVIAYDDKGLTATDEMEISARL